MPESKDGLDGRPEAQNLLGIYAALADQSLEATVAQFAGAQFSALKTALTDLAVEKLSPITAEMQKLMTAPDHVDAILADGAQRARAIAAPIMADVRNKVGFLSAPRK